MKDLQILSKRVPTANTTKCLIHIANALEESDCKLGLLSGSLDTANEIVNYLKQQSEHPSKECKSVVEDRPLAPQTIEEVIKREIDKGMTREKEHLRLLKRSFSDNWLFSEASMQDKSTPDGIAHFNLLIDYMEKAIGNLLAGKVNCPGPFDTWQLALPLALTYPTDKFDYSETEEDDDDPECFSEVLASGERVYIKAWPERHQLEPSVDKVQELTGKYLATALRLAKSKHSKSEDMWAKALGVFKRVNHAFRLAKNRPLIDQMAQTMVEASSRLAIDLSFNDEINDANSTSEKRIAVKEHVPSNDDLATIAIGKAYCGFVKYANQQEGLIKMDVFTSLRGKKDEGHPFTITNLLQWEVIKQIITSDDLCVKIDKSYLRGQTISQIFKKGSAQDGHEFYTYMRVSKEGPHSKWHIEQTPQKNKR